MDFDLQKKKCIAKIYKPDNSKKGSVDVQISSLLDKINELDDYYTTSSCAGRITLFVESKNGKKCRSDWLLVSHEPVLFENVKSALKKLPDRKVWFRLESSILHVCCRDLDDARKMLGFAKIAGFKHAGIMDFGSRIMLEIISTDRIDTPIAFEKKLFMSDDYLRFLIELANSKLKRTREKIKKLESLISKSFH